MDRSYFSTSEHNYKTTEKHVQNQSYKSNLQEKMNSILYVKYMELCPLTLKVRLEF